MDTELNSEWPAGGLESANVCPVCGEAERHLLYDALQDIIFKAAPGNWNVYQCNYCRSAFLDPRPSVETISLAYRNYYTHQAATLANETTVPATFWRSFRRSLRNGYINDRFGLQLRPANPAGAFLLSLFPENRLTIAYEFRGLRRPHPHARLLDVGCGNGDFLNQMNAVGWEVTGIEPDPEAVAVCRKAGLSVQAGSLTEFTFPRQSFDAITLSHVIEHLHTPLETLTVCNRILRPGGQIWMATPNIKSLSHARFGPDWRGLEIPRHLIIFNPASIRLALTKAGFTSIRFSTPTFAHTTFFYASSYSLQHEKAVVWKDLPRALRRKIRLAWIKALMRIGPPEQVIVSAVKSRCLS